MLKIQMFIMFLFFASIQAFALVAPPPKFLDSHLQRRAPRESRFPLALVKSGKFEEVKEAEWEACRRHRVDQRLFAASRDPLPLFLESPVSLDTLDKIEDRNLKAANLPENPWSGDYWAYARGILGSRFLDPDFSAHFDWLARYEFVQKNPAPLVIQQKGQEGVNSLSPSEKYDLLTGDSEGGFTGSQWAQGKEYYDETGKVEGWMGICHGWAPAAIMEPRPAASVEAVSMDGKWTIHFNPSEIKGLLSYSWATNSFPVVTLGERCNQQHPKRDPNGRFTQPECFDLNPGTWHLAVVHRIGLQQRSFVMDATYDYEVWNQPVIGYSYSYFNPETKQQTEHLQEAIVSRDQYSKDPYAKYRSAKTRSIVGVEMKVGYVVENGSSAEETDSPEKDLVRWVSYSYDLELDDSGKILGGEWYYDSHPDFIWTPKQNAKPLSAMDQELEPQEWQGQQPIPSVWAEAAKTEAPHGLILHAIAEGLLNRSKSQ